MPTLQAPLDKLEWANNHLNRFQSESVTFMASRPYTVVSEKNPQEGISDLRLKILKPLPPDFSLTLGDFIHNLRASLDYLVWQLSLLTCPKLDTLPSNTRPVTDVEFPIFLTCNENAIARRLYFVPDEAAEEIKALQPYHRGDTAHEDWLAVLHSLSNRDKHRQLTPIGILVRTEFLQESRWLTSWLENSVPLQDGAIITQLPTGFVEDSKGNLQMRATLEILFDKGGPPGGVRMDSLNNLNDYIRNTVFPKLSRFFQ